MKFVRRALAGAVALGLAGTVMAAETYLEAEGATATTPWELADSGDAIQVRPGAERNDNPGAAESDDVGSVRFSFSVGEVSAGQMQNFWIRYRSTNAGNNSVYVTAGGRDFTKNTLPVGDDYQWFNTGISQRSTDEGSVEFVAMNREAGLAIDRVYVSDTDAVPGDGNHAPPLPPTNPDPIVSPPRGDVNGVREYPAIGTKNLPKSMYDNRQRGWVKREWNRAIGKAYREERSAFASHFPAISTRIKWSEAYIDQGIKPTRAQARNPNWSNYAWNGKYDGIDEALNSSYINNGAGAGKLLIVVSLTATSTRQAPPKWMHRDSSLTWEEGKNKNDSAANWHVRFDNPRAVEHVSDFMEALLKKYGNNKGVHSIQLGEYYLGQEKYRPGSLNRRAYFNGVKTLWNNVADAAPYNAEGTRVSISQTSPWLKDGITLGDLLSAGIGVAESDVDLHLPVRDSAENLRRAYENNMHVTVGGDARYACQDRVQRWDGTSNPFGHRKGYTGVATPQELFWYHGVRGPVPVQSIFMTLRDGCKPQITKNFVDAIKTFGRGGSKAGRWGASPAIMN